MTTFSPTIGLLVIAALLLTGGATALLATEPNSLSPEERDRGFDLLFNGENLDGWNHSGNWEVDAHGAIARTDKGGSLVYTVNKVPDNFELRFEWKVSAKANSGIYYRPGQYEYQILDNSGHADGSNPRSSAAALYFCMPPSHDATKPVGEWNTGQIICKGSQIQHWLNGEKVVDFDYKDSDYADEVQLLKERGGDLKARGASLSLQDHGDPVWFRSIRMRKIGFLEKLDQSEVVPAKISAELRAAEQKKVEGIKKKRDEAKAQTD